MAHFMIINITEQAQWKQNAALIGRL